MHRPMQLIDGRERLRSYLTVLRGGLRRCKCNLMHWRFGRLKSSVRLLWQLVGLLALMGSANQVRLSGRSSGLS